MPGVEVASQGASVEEALSNLREALELYFEDAGSGDQSLPLVQIKPIEVAVQPLR